MTCQLASLVQPNRQCVRDDINRSLDSVFGGLGSSRGVMSVAWADRLLHPSPCPSSSLWIPLVSHIAEGIFPSHPIPSHPTASPAQCIGTPVKDANAIRGWNNQWTDLTQPSKSIPLMKLQSSSEITSIVSLSLHHLIRLLTSEPRQKWWTSSFSVGITLRTRSACNRTSSSSSALGLDGHSLSMGKTRLKRAASA